MTPLANTQPTPSPLKALNRMSNTAAVSGTPGPVPTRRTVDAFTRTLHALLALSFIGAYITAESEVFRLVHVSLGYTLGGLLVARLLWGLLGPRYVRWTAMWGKLRGLGDWLRGLRTGQASWRQAQNLYMSCARHWRLFACRPRWPEALSPTSSAKKP